TILWVGICSSTSAFSSAASTPKSPHPGHQSGSALPFMSAMVSGLVVNVAVAIFVFSSNHDFVCGHRKCAPTRELLFYSVYDVVRHERFAIVLADVSIGHKAGFAAQIT